MASFTRRFFAVRAAAQSLVSEIAALQHVCVSDRFSNDSKEREAAVVAVHHLDYALERARAAAVFPPPSLQIWTSERQRVDQDAYERFLEIVEHDMQQYQVESAAACNSLLDSAQLAASHARDAIKQAQQSYSSQGLVLKAVATN